MSKNQNLGVTSRSIMDELAYEALRETSRDVDRYELEELTKDTIAVIIEDALTGLVSAIEDRLADIEDARLDASCCPWLASTLAELVHEVASPHDKLQIADDLAEVFAELRDYREKVLS